MAQTLSDLTTKLNTEIALPDRLDNSMQFEDCARMLTLTHLVLAKLEERRKERTGPMFAAYKEEQELSKRVMEPYTQLKEVLVRLLSDYYTWRFEKDQRRYLIDGSDAARRGAMQIWDSAEVFQDSHGSVFAKESVKLQIEDVSAIPRDFMIPDEIKILKSLEIGLEIPGCKAVRGFVAVPKQPTCKWQKDEK